MNKYFWLVEANVVGRVNFPITSGPACEGVKRLPSHLCGVGNNRASSE